MAICTPLHSVAASTQREGTLAGSSTTPEASSGSCARMARPSLPIRPWWQPARDDVRVAERFRRLGDLVAALA